MELKENLALDSGFRGRQIFRWISRGIHSFHDMTDLPAILRDELAKKFPNIYSSTVIGEFKDDDGSAKLQIKLADHSVIEAVLLVDQHSRKTACLSTQVGCAMQCAFCKTGTLGLKRNLEAYEITEQFFHLMNKFGTISNIVFMGMGEPLLNLDNVRKAIGVFLAPDGLKISKRRITISTCGIVPGIMELADKGPDVRLAVSLTVGDNRMRESLMPVNTTWNLEALKQALLQYQLKTGERITLEIPLLGKINTSEQAANQLAQWVDGLSVQINVIAWNTVPELPYVSPTRKEIDNFISILKNRNLNVVQRAKRGSKIAGACGQLGNLDQM